jgi:hypothetical protein
VKLSHNHVDRSWAEERIEDYADGLLSGKEKKVFEAMLAGDEELRRHVDLARRIRDSLRATETPPCPPSVYEPVLAMARRESQAEPRPGFFTWLEDILQPRIAPARLIVVASVLLAAVLTTVVLVNEGNVQPAPGQEEVQAALDEVKIALSYVSLAGRETGSTIRHKAVEESIIDPIVRAIDHAEIGSGARRSEPRHRATSADANTRGKS